MSKNKAIEIIKNLSHTIEKLKGIKGRIVKISDNEMFQDPKISLATLKRKRKQVIDKYELKKEDYRERLQKELEHAVKDSKKRGQYKLNAWNLFKQRHETDLSKWSDYELGEFLDLFYEEKVKAEEQEQQDQDIQDTVEEVFGEVQDNTKNCPQCNSAEWIEDNRQKKASDDKFANIPDFTCSNYGQSQGCGWGGYIDSKGDRAVPTEWL